MCSQRRFLFRILTISSNLVYRHVLLLFHIVHYWGQNATLLWRNLPRAFSPFRPDIICPWIYDIICFLATVRHLPFLAVREATNMKAYSQILLTDNMVKSKRKYLVYLFSSYSYSYCLSKFLILKIRLSLYNEVQILHSPWSVIHYSTGLFWNRIYVVIVLALLCTNEPLMSHGTIFINCNSSTV